MKQNIDNKKETEKINLKVSVLKLKKTLNKIRKKIYKIKFYLLLPRSAKQMYSSCHLDQ